MAEDAKHIEAIPRVMFDTNTYRHIIDGTADQSNSAEAYQQIRQMIIDGKIEAFLSETLFTIEAIIKKDRLAFMSVYRPKITVDEKVVGSTINSTYTIGPDDRHKVDFNETGPLRDYYERAKILGFKIVRLPRIGWITNAEIKAEDLYKSADFSAYFTTACEVSEKIEFHGCGMQFVLDLLTPYDCVTNDISRKFELLLEDVNKLPLLERKKKIKEVAEAFAEMSDGDSVASSIGLDCCAFCTNDNAKSAGDRSVMSGSNIEWLKGEYGFNKLTPTVLVKFLKGQIN